MTNVFIDGSSGTTGLRIADRLEARHDINIIKLSDEMRKDPTARREAISEAEIVFLCLPDAAAVDAVALAQGASAKIIDTSTAHRTSSDWVYGMPELATQREKISKASLVANPGCHASGFIALVAPLVHNGIILKAE